MLYFEIIRNNKLLKRGTSTLNNISFSNELMFVPRMQLDLPIAYAKQIDGREEVKVYINDKVFHGFVINYQLDKVNETIILQLTHIIDEWSNRQLPTNLAVKSKSICELYDSPIFKFSDDWNITYGDGVCEYEIDYVYSRQNQLEALNKTCELTPDIFWRVNFQKPRDLEISPFGEKLPYILSMQPSGASNIQIISEPIIKHQFDHVINVGIVYGEKSDSGMSSMSLREVYDDPEELQDPEFPVVIIREAINNERHYKDVDYPELAPNNYFEYAVLDTKSIALESGKVVEGSFSFNDLSPFNAEDFEADEESGELIITDYDRKYAARTAYHSAIRRLRQLRRYYKIELDVQQLPADVNVGDQIRFIYANQMLELTECSSFMKQILEKDDWYYITGINYEIDASGMEHNTIVLEKELRISRESGYQ